MAGIDRLSTQNLWSLMGLTLRNAEKLGVHRDGALLGLSPAKTEERRRLWWQLQHIDLALSVRSGLTPMNLAARWDAKLPLNIEDSDINEGMKEFPKERKGMTSMSYCLFCYWVIDQQRLSLNSEKSRFELSWQSNETASSGSKESLVDQLEKGANEKFLQYCDPIRPLDALLQLLARALIAGMRLRTLQSSMSGKDTDPSSEPHRDTLLSISMRCLEYNVAMHTQPLIKNFRWLTNSFFSWYPCRCLSRSSTIELTCSSYVCACRSISPNGQHQSPTDMGPII